MALTVLHHQLVETQVEAFSNSIGATPVAASVRSPFRGRIVKVGVVQNVTATGTVTVTSAINGVTVTGGTIVIPTGGSPGLHSSVTPTGANAVAEDDVISFTPAGATGTTTGSFYAVIKKA